MTGSHERRLSRATIALYSLPAVPLGFTGALVSMYLLKFSTDVLLLAPAVVGLLFGVARLWDAVTDPLVGYWSDRTRSPLGRRRLWLLASALPAGLAFAALWSPPAGLAGPELVAWVGAGILLFYSAQTALNVPHLALGAELTEGYHDRSRVFGGRQLLEFAGILLAAGALSLLELASDVRLAATVVAAFAGLLTVGAALAAGAGLRERPEHQGRGPSRSRAAFADIVRNRHARLLLVVFFVDQLGFAALITLMPYANEYLLDRKGLSGAYVAAAMASALVCLPMWLPLSRRFGKRNVWIAAMGVKALAFGMLLGVGPGEPLTMVITTALIGGVQGAGGVLGPSIQSDVIDYDEYRTGERKEGAYFAVWNLAQKAAAGFAILGAGLVLQATGFQPNVEQGETARVALRALYAGLPFLFSAASALLMLRFRLDAREHHAIRDALEQRRAAAAAAIEL